MTTSNPEHSACVPEATKCGPGQLVNPEITRRLQSGTHMTTEEREELERLERDEPCIDCPPGSYCPGDNQELTCKPGEEPDQKQEPKSKECVLCKPGFYSSDGKLCEPCPACAPPCLCRGVVASAARRSNSASPGVAVSMTQRSTVHALA